MRWHSQVGGSIHRHHVRTLNHNLQKISSVFYLLLEVWSNSLKRFCISPLKHRSFRTEGFDNEGYISDRVTFNRVRILLIVTSGICTLIFSFYSLHNPEYEKQLAEKTQEASSRYTEQLKQIDTEFEKRMAGINAEVETWRQRLDTEAQQVINGVSEGPRYKAYVGRQECLPTQSIKTPFKYE